MSLFTASTTFLLKADLDIAFTESIVNFLMLMCSMHCSNFYYHCCKDAGDV